MTDLSKEAQLARSPGGNRKCSLSGALKTDCSCPRCVGWRNQQAGRKAQRAVRKALHLKPERYASKQGNEEAWTAALRLEVKSGKQVEAINRLYVEGRNQSDAARPIGDVRPFAYVAAPEGTTPLLVLRIDELRQIVQALIEEWS